MSRSVRTIKKRLHLPLLIMLMASLVFGALPPGQLSTVYAAPDTENLWSESNSAPNLILTNSTYADGPVNGTLADANGRWAKIGYWWEFVMVNSTAGGAMINSVTLYLTHYQGGWIDDEYKIQIYDGSNSTWLDVQTYTGVTAPPTSIITDNWDVTTKVDTWAKLNAAKVRIIGTVSISPEEAVQWFVDAVELRVDYTPPDISNTPSNCGFGLVTEGSTNSTGLNRFTVTNNSTYAVNITISATNMTGGDTWVLSNDATIGTNIYGLKAGLVNGSYSIIVKRDSPYNILVGGLGVGLPQEWGLQLLAPSTFTDAELKSGTVTLTATEA